MSETAGEKQFAPTAKRRRDAALKGDVFRSKELATAATVLAGLIWFAFAGPLLFEDLTNLTRSAFRFDKGSFEGLGIEHVLAQLPMLIAHIIGLGVLTSAVSLMAQLSIGEGRWVTQNLQFKGSRIAPHQGLKRMFGPQGLIEMGKGIIKVILLAALAGAWLWFFATGLMQNARLSLSNQLDYAWFALLSLIGVLCIGLAIIAMIDLPIQWMRRDKRLKMSHQEMKEENKQSEGSPEMRAARKQRQRDIATGGLATSMRDAQFVVTNPTHFSVAMAYDPGKASAPIVLVKGRGDKALAMREVAAQMALPVLEYPQLARSLYFTTREKQMIREELYAAVAMIVAFVLSIRRGETPHRPQITIPAELRFDSEGQLKSRADNPS